jgi:hypothetical protein
VSWLFLCAVIAATSAYPLSLWLARHTRLSEYGIAQSFGVITGLLFFPSWYVLYFIWNRWKGRQDSLDPNMESDQVAKHG